MAAIGVSVVAVCSEGRRKHMFTQRGSGVREPACIHCGAPAPTALTRRKPPRESMGYQGGLLELAQRAVAKFRPPPQFKCGHCGVVVIERDKAGHASRCGGTEHDFEPYTIVAKLALVP